MRPELQACGLQATTRRGEWRGQRHPAGLHRRHPFIVPHCHPGLVRGGVRPPPGRLHSDSLTALVLVSYYAYLRADGAVPAQEDDAGAAQVPRLCCVKTQRREGGRMRPSVSSCAWQPDESLAALEPLVLCAGGEVCRGCTHASCVDVQGSCGWALCCGSQLCSGCEQLGRGVAVRGESCALRT